MKKYLKVLFFGFILEFLFLQAKINYNFFFFIGLLLIVYSTINFKKQEFLMLLIFLIPNQRLLTFEENGVSILNGFFIYLFIKILTDKSNIKKFISPSFILIFYGIILVFLNDSLSEFFIIIKLIITSLVCFSLFSKAKSTDLYDLIMCFILGTLAASLLSFFSSSSFQIGYNRFTGGIGNDPNYTGTLLSLSLVLFLFITKRLNVNKIIKIIVPALLLFFGLLTMSRSFIFSSIIITLVYVLYNLKDYLIRTLLTLFSFSILFLEKLTYMVNNNNLFLILTDRIIDPKNGDISGGRIEYWGVYLDIISYSYKNLFFGVSFNSMYMFNIDQVAHNFFLEDILTFGLIGVLLIYSYLFYFFNYFKRNKITIYILLPLFIFMLNSFTLHSFLGMGGVTTFFICLIPLYITKKSKI